MNERHADDISKHLKLIGTIWGSLGAHFCSSGGQLGDIRTHLGITWASRVVIWSSLGHIPGHHEVHGVARDAYVLKTTSFIVLFRTASSGM